MKIYSVYDEEFRPYGKVVKGIKCDELVSAMEKIAMPESGTAYEPAIDSLEACKEANIPFIWASYGFGMACEYYKKIENFPELKTLFE